MNLMNSDFFISFGVLLLLYCLVRISFSDFAGARRERQLDQDEPPGSPIDAAPLQDRLSELRQDYRTPQPSQLAHKKSQMIAERREVVSRNGYFQAPPQPPATESDDHQDGSLACFAF